MVAMVTTLSKRASQRARWMISSSYELLQNMIWLEGKVGTAAKVTDYSNKAAALKTAINSRLWSSSAGLYVHSNSDTSRYPTDANMNAIRLGAAPADQVAGILSYFRSHG